MCSQNVFCLVSMYENNGSVVYMDVGWSRSTAEDWTWPVSASPLRWTEDRRPGGGEVTRGQARLQTGRGWSDCRVSSDVFVVGLHNQMDEEITRLYSIQREFWQNKPVNGTLCLGRSSSFVKFIFVFGRKGLTPTLSLPYKC